MRTIDPYARLIAALAETMNDSMWASDILGRFRQIEEAAEQIKKIAQQRQGGER